MHPMAANSTSWFGARSVVAAAVLAVAALAALATLAQAQDGCKMECYPNLKLINGKGGLQSKENCRWIMRTDGKAARLCDHIKCRKVCPNNQAAASSAQLADQQEAASSVASDNLHIEQQIEGDQPSSVASSASSGESMGIMRQLHGNKLAKAPVPGVAGGRLSAAQSQSQQQPISPSGRRMAPTLPPSAQYDERDTPPPISRFLDISPEE